MTDGIWLRFLSGPDIDGLGLTRLEIVDAVEAAVREHGEGRTSVEPRVHLMPDNDGIGHFNVLRGHLNGLGDHGISGVKVVGDFVPNYRLGLPSELAMATLFDLDEIRVTSRRPESREKFAAELSAELSTPVRVVATAEEAFDGADVLVEATRLSEPEPLLRTAAVRPGAFVVPYGTVSAVELDLLDVMDKVVVDDWREARSGRFGSLRRHVDTGRLSPQTLYGEIGEIVAGRKPGRENDAERTLFWHRGLSLLDVAIAHLILRRAEAADAGTMLRFH